VLGGYWILLITTESGLLNISESENCQFQNLKKNQNQRLEGPPVISKPSKNRSTVFMKEEGKDQQL
jgi:hypothetical protein